MGDSTLKKVIIVVLVLMFISPLFDSDIYLDAANALDYTADSLNKMLLKNNNTPLTTADINTVMGKVLDDLINKDYYLMYFTTPFNEIYNYQHSAFN
jgi:hypothetical protein